MSLHLPEYIVEAEGVDCMDPLAILLMREGANEEAYQMHRQYMASAQQIVLGAVMQQRPDLDEYEQRVISRKRHN